MYIILFLQDKIKWINLLENNEKINNIIINLKENIIHDNSLPEYMIELIKYCRNLDFEEKPDYEYIMSNLNNN